MGKQHKYNKWCQYAFEYNSYTFEVFASLSPIFLKSWMHLNLYPSILADLTWKHGRLGVTYDDSVVRPVWLCDTRLRRHYKLTTSLFRQKSNSRSWTSDFLTRLWLCWTKSPIAFSWLLREFLWFWNRDPCEIVWNSPTKLSSHPWFRFYRCPNLTA